MVLKVTSHMERQLRLPMSGRLCLRLPEKWQHSWPAPYADMAAEPTTGEKGRAMAPLPPPAAEEVEAGSTVSPEPSEVLEAALVLERLVVQEVAVAVLPGVTKRSASSGEEEVVRQAKGKRKKGSQSRAWLPPKAGTAGGG